GRNTDAGRVRQERRLTPYTTFDNNSYRGPKGRIEGLRGRIEGLRGRIEGLRGRIEGLRDIQKREVCKEIDKSV
ncbi:hypothetical protein ACK3Z6_20485, partial [Aeromonas caviae]